MLAWYRPELRGSKLNQIVDTKEANKASQANVMPWEEIQEQPSDDISNNDQSVEYSETSVVEQQVEEW